MLPHMLYELLPYIYLGAGAFGSVLFDSDIIFLASIIIIFAGFIILWMRIDYRWNSIESISENVRHVERSGIDRRQKQAVMLPIVDNAGNLIRVDRRIGERRFVEV